MSYIDNMVCDRCKMVVSHLLQELEINVISVHLGEVALGEDPADTMDDEKCAILTWWVIPITLAAGFVTPWPFNYWRVEKIGKPCH